MLLSILLTHEVAVAAPDAASKPLPEDIVDFDIASLLQTHVEVGSLRQSQRVMDAPAVVDIVTSEQIERLGVRDLRELLMAVLGTYEWNNQAAQMLIRSVFLRGGPAGNRFLLLLDDHVLNDAGNEFYDLYALPVGAIERVEFLRGPAAVLYGSSAMAGVIRIVTKTAQNLGAGTRAAVNRRVVTHGEAFGDIAGYASVEPTVVGEPLRVRVDIQTRQSQDARLNAKTPAGIVIHRQDVRSVSAMMTARYRGAYTRMLWHEARAFVVGLENTSGLVAPGPSRGRLWDAEVGYQGQLLDWHFDGRAAADVRRRRLDIGSFPVVASGPPTDFIIDEKILRTTAGASRDLGDWSVLSLGVQYRHATISDAFFVDRTTGSDNPMSPTRLASRAHDIGVLGELEISIGERLKVLPATRIGWFNARAQGLRSLSDDSAKTPFRLYPMWRVAALWKLSSSTVAKAMLGRAFRLPNITELFADIPPFVMPNLDLRPELQDTLELALDSAEWSGWTVRTNLFLNMFKDAIENRTAKEQRFVNLPDRLHIVGGTARVERKSHQYEYRAGTSVQGCWNSPRCEQFPLPWLIIVAGATWKPIAAPEVELSPRLRFRSALGSSDELYEVSVTAAWQVVSWLRVGLVGLNVLNHSMPRPYTDSSWVAELRRGRVVEISVSLDI